MFRAVSRVAVFRVAVVLVAVLLLMCIAVPITVTIAVTAIERFMGCHPLVLVAAPTATVPWAAEATDTQVQRALDTQRATTPAQVIQILDRELPDATLSRFRVYRHRPEASRFVAYRNGKSHGKEIQLLHDGRARVLGSVPAQDTLWLL
jgi:hypothetical protein